MNNDNYPMGAASDPDAPYNEPVSRERMATVTVRMVKDVELLTTEGEDEDPEQLYTCQELSIGDCLRACAIVCQELLSEGRQSVDGIFMRALLNDCQCWEEAETQVEWRQNKTLDFV